MNVQPSAHCSVLMMSLLMNMVPRSVTVSKCLHEHDLHGVHLFTLCVLITRPSDQAFLHLDLLNARI